MRYPNWKPFAFKAQFRGIKIYEAVKNKYDDNLRIFFENFKVYETQLIERAWSACE